MLVKLHNTETLRVIHIVAEDRGAIAICGTIDSIFQSAIDAMAGKNIVPQHHGHRIIAYEIRADNKCLRQSVRRRLHRIAEMQPELAAILQKSLKSRRICRCRNNQDIPDACIHQY